MYNLLGLSMIGFKGSTGKAKGSCFRPKFRVRYHLSLIKQHCCTIFIESKYIRYCGIPDLPTCPKTSFKSLKWYDFLTTYFVKRAIFLEDRKYVIVSDRAQVLFWDKTLHNTEQHVLTVTWKMSWSCFLLLIGIIFLWCLRLQPRIKSEKTTTWTIEMS